MKAVEINTYGNNEVVSINLNKPIPIISDGQLLVKMHAAGVNPVDWKIRAGYLQQIRPLNFPVTLGMDFSGVVEEVGSNVTGFKRGDEVYGMTDFFNGGTGTFAEYFLTDAKVTAHKPKNISHIDAAAIPMVAVSALQALVDYMNLSKNQKILIHGGGGGIGAIAIQLAKHLGAYIATTASGNSKYFVTGLGADEVIDYKSQKFEDILHNYDAVFDTVGGIAYLNSFKVLKKGGIIVSMRENPNEELMKQYGVKSIIEFTEVDTSRLCKLAELVESKIIKPIVAKDFPLIQARDAIEYLQHGHPQGKVVITAF